MKQFVQSLHNGKLRSIAIRPHVAAVELLVRATRSLVSASTEKPIR